jgi:hypothetical protein
MNPSFDAEVPVDRWAIRLDEPAASERPVAHASGSDAEDADPTFLPFTFTMDVPSADFQPRLSRFDEAA